MNVFLVLVALATLSHSQQTDQATEDRKIFKEWCKKHNKQYKSHGEELTAFEKFSANKAKIEAHNKLYEEGKFSYKRGLWEHSDLSYDEKRKLLTGVKIPVDHQTARLSRAASSYPNYLVGPDSIDWTEKGLVGPVEQQAQCGSCWAFSAAAIVASVMRKKYHNKDQFAPQQLVDCSHHGTSGCSGGWPEYALNYVKDNGITDEDEYPYVGYERTCEYTDNDKIGVVSEVFNIPTRGNETWLKNIVGTVGPVSVVICDEESFQNYQSGVYYQENCCTETRHAPVITGYGTDPKHGDYWIVKNSWGDSWGENGYARIARGVNMCNIAYYAVYAT